jgi:hypothetical protein
MKETFQLMLGAPASLFKSRAKLGPEILILRQQINVLRRQAPKRPHLNNAATHDGHLRLADCVPINLAKRLL